MVITDCWFNNSYRKKTMRSRKPASERINKNVKLEPKSGLQHKSARTVLRHQKRFTVKL